MISPFYGHSLLAKHLPLDEAWPAITFEKANAERASLQIGMFINGSLIDDTDTVIARIEEAGLFGKLVDYVVERAGPEYHIVRAKVVAAWMSDHSKPMLDVLQKAAARHAIAVAGQKEFAGTVEDQLEIVGSHVQQLNAIYQKIKQAAPE